MLSYHYIYKIVGSGPTETDVFLCKVVPMTKRQKYAKNHTVLLFERYTCLEIPSCQLSSEPTFPLGTHPKQHKYTRYHVFWIMPPHVSS